MVFSVEVAVAAIIDECRACSIEEKVDDSGFQLTSLNCSDGGTIGSAELTPNSIAYCFHSEFQTLAITSGHHPH